MMCCCKLIFSLKVGSACNTMLKWPPFHCGDWLQIIWKLARVPCLQWWSNICGRTRIGVYLLSNTTIWWIDIYTIYYIGTNYMFWHFPLAIFMLIYEKLSKQLYSTCVYCIHWGGERWSGYELSHVLCGYMGSGRTHTTERHQKRNI